MSIVELAHGARAPTTGPVVDGNVEVLFERRAWAERDRVLIFVWSGEASLIDVLAEQRLTSLGSRWFLRDAKGRMIRIEVCYAGKVVVCSEIVQNGRVVSFSFTHSGGHLDVTAFSVRHDSAPDDNGQSPNVRAVIVLEDRPETETELLVRRLFPEPDDRTQQYPSSTELLALRRALS